MQLRSYQREALEASLTRFKAGISRQLIVLPTGMGKTVVFANLPQHHQLPGKMLVLVHREELACQAADKLRRWNPDLRVGVEMGTTYAYPKDDVVVASVPTIGRLKSGRLLKFDPDAYSLVVCDEAHHSVSPSYKTVFEYFGFLGPTPSRLLLGFTATPNRGDKQP